MFLLLLGFSAIVGNRSDCDEISRKIEVVEQLLVVTRTFFGIFGNGSNGSSMTNSP